MSKIWEKAVQEEMSKERRSQILDAARVTIDGYQSNIPEQSFSWFSWVLAPARGALLVGGAACALAVTLYVARPGAITPSAILDGDLVSFADDQEMIQNSAILLDLEVLENWKRLKKGNGEKWSKKKS